MEPKIFKETFNLFFNKLAKLFNSFFPGMVILELFFKKGYFSNPPIDIFSFILFLIWCGILSIPYNMAHPMSIEKFKDNFLKSAFEKFNLSKEAIDQAISKMDDNDEMDDVFEGFELGFILIKLALTYIVYKILLYVSFPSFLIFEIPAVIIQLFTTLFLATVISYPAGFIYSKAFLLLIKKYLNTK